MDGEDVPTWYPDLRQNVSYVLMRRPGSVDNAAFDPVPLLDPLDGLPHPETAKVIAVHYINLEAMRLLGNRTQEEEGGSSMSATILEEIKDISKQNAPDQIRKKENVP